MSKINTKQINKDLEIYINNIETDYTKIENILQNELLIKDNKFYINYKLKIFQDIFKSLQQHKKDLIKYLDNVSTSFNNSNIHILNLFSKYPNIIDPKFNSKLAKSNIIQQYTGINTFQDLSQKLYSLYSNQNNNLDDFSLIENNYSIWKLSPIQKILRNFISTDTPYYGILIIHGTGVGKTCTAITIAENFKDYVYDNNTKIQVIRPDEFQRQIFEINKLQKGETDMQCTGTTYIDALSDQATFMEAVKDCEISKNKETKDKACKKVEKTINRKIAEYYDFKSRIIWAKNIIKTLKLKTRGLTGIKRQRKIIDTIRQEFNNSVIIIDEAHNLRNLGSSTSYDETDTNNNDNTEQTTDNENLNIVQILELVLLVAQNVRLVLLSATPMYDRASDITPLLNLLLLNDYRPRLSNKDLFIDDYGTLKPNTGENKIKTVSRGYISYVRGNDPINFPLRLNADLVLPSKDIFNHNDYPKYDITGKKKILNKDKLHYFTLVNCPLTKTHSNAIINKDTFISKSTNTTNTNTTTTNTNTTTTTTNTTQVENILDNYTKDDYKYSVAYSTELQLGNFMYNTPTEAKGNFTETYGVNGFNSFFTKNKSGSYIAKDETKLSRFTLNKGLEKYGPKIAKIIKSLEQAQGPIAIYSNYINGGLIPVAIALELAGYTRYDGVKELLKYKGKPKQSKGEYVLFTGDKVQSKGGEKYVNMRGSMINEKNVKVFLFSSAGSEGLSLFGYREMHILEPWHNINLMEQSIGRIIRNKSHYHLPAKQRNATVYMYASTFSPEFKDRESIDLRIYSICEQKAIAIGNIETILKSNAFDCIVSRPMNIRNKEYFGSKIELENSHGKIINVDLEDVEYSRDTAYQKSGEYVCNVSSSTSFKLDMDTKNGVYLDKLKKNYNIEIRELTHLLIKVLQHQNNLSYNDVENIVMLNLDVSPKIKNKISIGIIELVLENLKLISKNKVIVNKDGEECKVFIISSKSIKNIKTNITNSKSIIKLLPLNRYNPNLDILYQIPVSIDKNKKQIPRLNAKEFKNVLDYSKMDIKQQDKYHKNKDVDLFDMIDIKKKRFQDLQKKEELSLNTILKQIEQKIANITIPFIELSSNNLDEVLESKFNFNTNFNISNTFNIGYNEIVNAVFQRLLINEKTFIMMYLIIKLIISGYKSFTKIENIILEQNISNIVLDAEINFLKKLTTSKDDNTSSRLSIITKLENINIKDVKGFIIANDKDIVFYEVVNSNIDNAMITSYKYLKGVYKDNKINLDKVLKSKYKKIEKSRLSRLFGYLVYEKKFQQPKFKITDYISRGYKKSVKGIFCANKQIGEINKLVNMLVPMNYMEKNKFIVSDKKNKKVVCGDLEILFRLRNNYKNNTFDSRLEKNNTYFLSPEDYFIYQKYNPDFS